MIVTCSYQQASKQVELHHQKRIMQRCSPFLKSPDYHYKMQTKVDRDRSKFERVEMNHGWRLAFICTLAIKSLSYILVSVDIKKKPRTRRWGRLKCAERVSPTTSSFSSETRFKLSLYLSMVKPMFSQRFWAQTGGELLHSLSPKLNTISSPNIGACALISSLY